MAKRKQKLKKFNGRGHGVKFLNTHLYVGAKNQSDAAELVSIACYGRGGMISLSEIRDYYHKNAWGDAMDGIELIEECVYVTRDDDKTPERLV